MLIQKRIIMAHYVIVGLYVFSPIQRMNPCINICSVFITIPFNRNSVKFKCCSWENAASCFAYLVVILVAGKIKNKVEIKWWNEQMQYVLHLKHTFRTFVMAWFCKILPISSRVTSLALSRSYDYLCAWGLIFNSLAPGRFQINFR